MPGRLLLIIDKRRLLTGYPGLTTESDIMLVENMVKSYMSNGRTMSDAAVLPQDDSFD